MYTTKWAIEQAKEIHGDRYDYSEFEYVNARTKSKIICDIHGIFKQSPNSHIKGRGCNKCSYIEKAEKYRKPVEQFVKECNLVHNYKYDYSKFNYINNYTKGIIICDIHGKFEQSPNSHLVGKHGCANCKNDKDKKSQHDFIKEANNIHNNIYDYSKVNYINSKTKVKIICKIHGIFKQIPDSHVRGMGCRKCGREISKKKQTKSIEVFIKEANIIHDNLYDYSQVNYINTNTKVEIICKNHGKFEQIPKNHLKGSGCPKCITLQYSKKCIKWLNKISQEENIYIQHAENESEFKIPYSNFKADGYCKETNTIYEFYGKLWHGHYDYCDWTEVHPINKRRYDDLYNDTIKREEYILSLGFKLITIWEHDWDKMKK